MSNNFSLYSFLFFQLRGIFSFFLHTLPMEKSKMTASSARRWHPILEDGGALWGALTSAVASVSVTWPLTDFLLQNIGGTATSLFSDYLLHPWCRTQTRNTELHRRTSIFAFFPSSKGFCFVLFSNENQLDDNLLFWIFLQLIPTSAARWDF